MKQKIIEVITLLGAFLVTAGFLSCSKEETPVAPEPEVVSCAEVLLEVGDDAQTKASYDQAGRILYWQEGDQLVLFSNDKINGILSCTSVDGSGKATFSGTISSFTPEAINVYFFCNKPVGSSKPNFDFSLQNGNAVSVSHYLFLKSLNVKFEKIAEHQYEAAEKLQFEALTSILDINVVNAGAPVPSGTKASSVKIDGLKNQMTVDLKTGEVTSSFVKTPDFGTSGQKDLTTTTIAPRNTADYSTNYLVALIPQASDNVTMIVNYADGSYNGLKTYWNVIKWSVGAGNAYVTDWDQQSVHLDILDVSPKAGYAGVAVDTGENADGTSHKGGYNGVDPEGSVDNPNGQKGGYNGTEVL